MRVCVVGATGVLGRDLVPLLLQQRYQVRALVRSVEKAQRLALAGADVIPFDLLAKDAPERLPALLDGFDAAIHIATAIPRDPTAPHAWDANTRLRTEGTRAFLDAALAVHVEHYIQQSIVMAYPDSGDEWIDESMPLDSSPSRASITAPVIAMEAMVRAVPREQMRWCILRGGSFVGPGTAQDDLISNLIAGRIAVGCDGRNYISPVHVADMATAVAAALAAPAASIFNIVDEPIRQGDYADRLAARVGASPPPRDMSKPCPPSWRCANRAARTTLGWIPTHGIGL